MMNFFLFCYITFQKYFFKKVAEGFHRSSLHYCYVCLQDKTNIVLNGTDLSCLGITASFYLTASVPMSYLTDDVSFPLGCHIYLLYMGITRT